MTMTRSAPLSRLPPPAAGRMMRGEGDRNESRLEKMMTKLIITWATIACVVLSVGCSKNSIAEKIRAKAEAGDAEAQFHLGSLYETGRLLRTNMTEAVRWYQLAAQQKFPDAQSRLADLYSRGEGVPLDYQKAEALYLEAANHGFARAQMKLGSMYFQGRGIPKDAVKACMWMKMAAETGESAAKSLLSTVQERMTPEQIAEAEQLLRQHRK